MDGTDLRAAASAVLPLASVGGQERRACASFALRDGSLLVHQVVVASGGGEPAQLTAFSAMRPSGSTEWGVPSTVAMGRTVAGPPSLEVPPVLLEGHDAPLSAWALAGGSLLLVGQDGVTVEDGPGGRVTALSQEGGRILTAVRAPDGAVRVVLRDGDGAWRTLTAGPLAGAGEITAVAAFQGQVHAAVADAREGFSLWRAPLEGAGPWESVITRGAFRYGYNRAVSAMVVVGGRLLVAADGPATSAVRIGDEHPEILAVAPDGNWRLVSGQARFSPAGLLRPEWEGGPAGEWASEMTIGGLRAEGDDLLLWMRPRAMGRAGPVSVLRRTTSGWSKPRSVAAPALAVLGVAIATDGSILVGAGGDSEAGGLRRPLLVEGAAE